jgi:uncharacterized protein with HEPN domain
VKDQAVYLRHILDSIIAIQEFTRGGREFFLSDRKTQDAVLRNVQTLAESAKRLAPELKDLHPAIDWAAIAGTRNILVHDYLGVNLETVWGVVERGLPPLKAAVEDLLGRFQRSRSEP